MGGNPNAGNCFGGAVLRIYGDAEDLTSGPLFLDLKENGLLFKR